MQRLRRQWLALMGAILVLTLTVSAAFGAPPTGDDANRGQTISSFVHDLVFGDEDGDEDADQEEDSEDEDLEEDAEEEDSEDEDLEEDAEEEDSEDARQVPDEFANHGECVSEAAHDTEGFEESDAANKGEWVSLHARFTCWGLEPTDDEEEQAGDDESEGASDEEADADELSAKEQAKADREAARAERQAAREAAKAEREAARAEGATQNTARGGGHGRGGGKP